MEEAIDKNTVPETAEDSLYQEKDEDNETSDVKDERDEKDGEDNETSDVKDERGTPLEDEIASNASESNKGEKDENKDEAEDEDEEIPEDDNEEGVEEISNSGDNNAVAETSNDKRENAEEGKDENKEVEDTTENSNVAEEEKQTSENIEHNRNDKDENEKEDQTSPASESFQEESESKTSPNNENDRVGEEAEVEVEAENENDENLSKDDGRENSIPDIEEVDANVSINKTNQQDDEEDVLSDDRTQTAEKQKSPPQSQMDIDTEESENKIGTNDDTLDDTSKTSDVQDVEMKSVESTADASEKEKSTEISENDKQSKQSEDKFDQLFDNVRKSTDAEPMETEDADPDPFEKDIEESQDGDKDECGGDNILENRDEPDNSNQADNASQSELPDTENDNEIVETQSENVQEEAQGESADVCLIPDNDEELTGAEKEQAILARQNAEKEDAEKEQAENEATENTEADQDKETNEPDVETQEAADDIIIEPDIVIEVENRTEDDVDIRKIPILSVIHINEKCIECSVEKSCGFRFKNNENDGVAYSYVCNQDCCDSLINKEEKIKFFVRKRKYIVEDLSEPMTESCVACKEKKKCKYTFKQDEDVIYICTDDCFNNLSKDEPDKLKLKRSLIRVKNLSSTTSTLDGSVTKSASSEPKINARTAHEAELAKLNREASFERRCANCCLLVHMTAENLIWETLDFCNQLCLSKYQHTIGEKCRTCNRAVSQTSLGKYCVRFGFEICQFCCAACLDKYKKSLKNCSYCQLDISKTNDGFLAPVGDNEQFKDFCSQLCMKKYDSCINPKRKTKIEQCSVCNNKKSVQVELILDERGISFCSNPCFSAFKFVNNIVPDKCNLCSKYFERKSTEHFTIYQDNVAQIFCGKICMNMFITQKRKIVFCQWCKVKKYNFDMIEKQQLNSNEKVTMCSLNCLVLYGVSLNRITKQKVKCDYCVSEKTPQYHLTMSDSSMRNFCTYQCVMQFQSRFSSTPLTLDNDSVRQNELNQLQEGSRSNLPFPTGLPKRIKSNVSSVQSLHVPLQSTQSTIPIIANITSLASDSPAARNRNRNRARSKNIVETYPPQNITKQNRLYGSPMLQSKSSSIYPTPKIKVPKKTVGTTTKEPANKTFVVELPLKLKVKSNMNTQCMPQTETVGVTCKPQSCDSEIQTDNDLRSKKLIPIPIPIYIPQPIQGFPIPRPIPIPFAFPIPVPIFIPTTKNSAQGIMKEIKKLQDKMPADPYEAELLMMAELVASDKKKEEESEEENNEVGYNNDNSYGEDVLQMALKMATEYDEPPSVDLGSAISNDSSNLLYPQMQINQRSGRGKKRINPTNNIPRENNIQPIIKKRRTSENEVSPSQTIPVEKPDANMCLKYTFGVNAWKQWVMTKNSELEKSSIRRKPFKSELLQMTADELSFSLCLFVKEVRKPNGTEYAPDTIYYLVLGIQQYLYENGRIDNIFTDPYYERFTDCLDDVARKFSVLYNDSQYIVTRVEEEHLWECKQLGAHSPHVLLSTLMFFNTKHFNLTTVEEHMQLSFSHIMKHWKRNAQGTKQPGSRNVLLRFYPPNTGQDLQLQPQETQDGNVGAESVNKALGDILNIQDSSSVLKTIISMVVCTDQTCSQCNKNKNCEYRFKDNETGEFIYICEQACIDKLIGENHDKYLVRKRKFMIEDLSEPKTEICLACKEEKICNFYFKQDEDSFFICSTECYNNLDSKEPNKLRMKRNSIRVKNLGAVSMSQNESSTNEVKIVARTAQEAEVAKLDREASFVRRCIGCTESLQFRSSNLKWQSFDFCNQLCLSKYQQNIGSKCRMCFGSVLHPSLGKYCVRFGFEICQFCCASCLDKYKKSLKNCSYCQKDISKTSEGFLAPVGDNEQFKDFCSQNCMKKYDTLMNPEKKIKIEQCFVCNNKKTIQVNLTIDGRDIHFCSNPCFSAFKFVNNVVPDKCDLCSKYFERQAIEAYTIYNEDPPKMFCGKICFNMFITKNRKIVFCQWCKVKKYNFDMIERAQSEQSEGVIMCSLNCLVLYEVSLNRITKQKMKCDNCLNEKTPQYHLTMSDSSIRNFCTYQCVMQFQSQFSTAPLTIDSEASIHLQDKSGGIFPTGLPKRIKSSQSAVQTLHIAPKPQSTVPVISNITSLAAETLRKSNKRPSSGISPQLRQTSRGYSSSLLESSVNSNLSAQSTLSDYSPPLQVYKNSVGTMTTDTNVKTTIITVPPIPPKMSNKRIMCKPITQSKGVTCKPLSFNTGIQTDEDMTAKILIPVPVPIYVPQPMHMYSLPFPVPVPIPLPIPIPIFIPTTRNSAAGILKEIKKIHDKMPSDPFEAELLMMAEMVAGENKKDESDSDDDDEGAVAIVNDNFNNDVIVGSNNSYGEDVLQMALKMATEYDEPAVDLESAMTASTITQPPPGTQPPPDEPEEDDQPMLYQMPMHMPTGRGRGRKRGSTNSPRGTGAKRGRRNDSVIHQPVETVAPVQTPPTIIPAEKPDANMCLKYTFGVNAWKQWVMTKNAELEKSPVRRKPFKSELLQMTADELSYSLCLFVKEVRKPNGTEYAPDTIYYLVLGIQQYLYENGRIDNIFTDPYYERFTDCLDDVARKFSVLYNDSQYIVTRVEEEHLWECKQLGAHSPHVLLSTLMFFNTKHFNLTSVEEHMQLSFSHIMKHWKRSPQGAKQPGSRNVLLRFYPPQAGQDSRKKKVYEQQENEANPLRCPVRLYEFYLSKCPESVKTRNDVFYLQPERSCVPDSPVWYSTQPLTQESLQKMLHRVKMVKEINVAILNI